MVNSLSVISLILGIVPVNLLPYFYGGRIHQELLIQLHDGGFNNSCGEIVIGDKTFPAYKKIVFNHTQINRQWTLFLKK